MDNFKALVVESAEAGSARVQTLNADQLPAGDVLVKVAYSTLNYKDGLAITGKGKVIRKFPMVPGIDFSGTVVESASPSYKPGDEVILTGWGVGETHWGGMAGLARVKSEWLVPLPKGLSLRHAMGLGTAGFTAMLCVMALQEHHIDQAKEVVVTGAAGGVGSVAVAVLAKLGYRVTASTGRPSEADYLKSLGAAEILDRAVLSSPSKPLEAERFGGAVDSVGGTTLAGILARMATNGSVASTGVAGGAELQTTVFPFILRGVNLLGVNSVTVPLERRQVAWQRLASEMAGELLESTMQTIGLEQVPEYAEKILAGQVRGRVVVEIA